MKKTIYAIMGLVAGLVAFSACTDKEFLTEDPKTIFTMDNAFAKASQVDAQLGRVYSAAFELHSWGTSNVFAAFSGSPAALLGGYGADLIEGDAQKANAAGGFSNYSTLNSLTGRFLSLWNSLYQMASYANLALYGAEQVDWPNEADKAYAVAQAKFFIGWTYLRLGEVYGGVPIVTEFSEDLKYDYVRNTRQEVYQWAIDNLEAAAAALPQYPAQDGRVAQGAAKHYLAEAYLAMGVETGDKSWYTAAEKAADEVIALHPLMTKRFGVRSNPADQGTSNGIPNYRPDGNAFYDLFQIGNYDRSEGNTEALWVMQNPTYEQYANNGGETYELGTVCGQPYRDLLWADAYREDETGAATGPWRGDNIDQQKYPYGGSSYYCSGGSWGLYGTTDYADADLWTGEFANDDRNAQCVNLDPVVIDQKHSLHGQIIKPEMLSDPARYMRYSVKISLNDGWGWTPNNVSMGQPWHRMYGRDWYAARSGETYLIKAEAQFRNGKAGDAAETINVIRARANATKMFTAGDISIATILDERGRELLWEEHRWPTLLRLAKQGEKNTDMHNQIMNHAMLVKDQPTYTGGAPAWSLFPIPLSVIQLNTEAELTQNQGW